MGVLPALAKVLGRKHYKLELGFGKRISEPTGREAARGRNDFLHATAPAGMAVTVSARLHVGFLGLNGEFGRRFGSLGLSISRADASHCVAPARLGWPDWGSASRGATRSGDAGLKQRGLNPGASADLTVATLFVRRLRDLGLPNFSPDVLRSRRNND